MTTWESQRIGELEAKVETLQERVAYLESEMGIAVDHGEIATIITRLSVRSSVARTIMALYRAKGRWLTRGQIEEMLNPDYTYSYDSNMAAVMICHARRVLGWEAIENIVTMGWRLTEIGLARVRACLDLQTLPTQPIHTQPQGAAHAV